MKINTIRLQNYRGIRDLSLDFDKNLTVFFGENGSGKSTVIDSIAIMLSWLVNRLRYSSSTSGNPITEKNIANGNAYTNFLGTYSFGLPLLNTANHSTP